MMIRQSNRRRPPVLTVLLSALAMTFGMLSFVASPTADAAFPGGNGQLAFEVSGLGIVVMDADATFRQVGYWPHEYSIDGTGFVPFYRKSAGSPTWSPDGARLAFTVDFHLSDFGASEDCDVGPNGGGIGVMNADGTGVDCLLDTAGSDGQPAWSPDGTELVYTSEHTGSTRLYVFDLESGTSRLLIDVYGIDPVWSPDGSRIAFRGWPGSANYNQELYVVRPDGTGLTRLTDNSVEEGHPDWSPDGSQLVFYARTGPWYAQSEIVVMDATDGSGRTSLTTTTSADEYGPTWSPDGTSIVFTRGTSSGHQLFVMPAAGGPARQLTVPNPAGAGMSAEEADWQCTDCIGRQGSFWVDPHADILSGWGWSPDQAVSVTVDGVLFPNITNTDSTGAFYRSAGPGLPDYAVGETVEVAVGAGPSAPSTAHVVLDLDVGAVTAADDTVSGTAPPGVWVRVVITPGDPRLTVVTSVDGAWATDFSTIGFDLVPGQTGVAVRDGPNGNQTKIGWRAPTEPIVGPVVAPMAPVMIDQEITAEGWFSDPGAGETHTAVWDWGDGTTSSGDVAQAAGVVTGHHVYTTTGIYEVTLTVTDEYGDSGSAGHRSVVVYDPSGGFVTGGGWIDSPAGAYRPDPSLAGKATFGFVSRYKKGAVTPTGATQFVFRVAGLEFHSTSYDWLVINTKKATYKGTGLIGGADHYGFMLTAIDESLTPSTDVDLFRIRIWDTSAGDAIVYDNLIEADETGDPTTAIGAGSIVIHKAK